MSFSLENKKVSEGLILIKGALNFLYSTLARSRKLARVFLFVDGCGSDGEYCEMGLSPYGNKYPVLPQ